MGDDLSDLVKGGMGYRHGGWVNAARYLQVDTPPHNIDLVSLPNGPLHPQRVCQPGACRRTGAGARLLDVQAPLGEAVQTENGAVQACGLPCPPPTCVLIYILIHTIYKHQHKISKHQYKLFVLKQIFTPKSFHPRRELQYRLRWGRWGRADQG